MAQFFSLVKPPRARMPTIAETLAKSAELDRLLAAPLKEATRMSKLADMAERARMLRAKHRELADQATERMGVLDMRGQEALAGMTRVLAEHERDIAALESELNQMSNDPTGRSQG